MQQIHPSAIIDPSVRLGAGVSVGPYTVVAGPAEIGEGCEIGSHVMIHPFTRLGAGSRIHAGAMLGDVPQDMAFDGVESGLEIGEHCTIREGVTVHRGTRQGSLTRVGERCYLMANSHVGHNTTLGNDVILANGVLLAGYVEVGDRAFLSGNAVVHQFCRVGRLAMMSGLSALSKDLPPFCVMRSSRLNRVAGLNVVGMRRAGIGPEDRAQIKRAFHALYRSGRNVGQSLAGLRADFPAGPAAELWQFAEKAKRGICGIEQDSDEAG